MKKVKKPTVSEVVLSPLVGVKPNPWNPNALTAFEKESLKFGIREDGWLASHALTVWRTDSKGKERNLIIDGEHRWRVALDLGMTMGPMAFVDGMTEDAAKKLTVKLDAKRGKFDAGLLEALVRSIADGLDLETRSLALGIGEDVLGEMLSTTPETMVVGELPSGKTSDVKVVTLFFTPEVHDEFERVAKEISVRFKTPTMADTVFEAVRRAVSAPR